MLVVALTGGLGSGKSTVAGLMREHGAIVIDLDAIARDLVLSDPVISARIAATFPSAVGWDGRLDREELASAAFHSADATNRLNAIVHPALAAEVAPALAELRLMPEPPAVVVIEVPLLVEAPVFAELADTVVAVEAPEDTRVQRAVAQGMSAHDARFRIERQASDAERREMADHVIDNSGDLEDLRGAVEEVWRTAIVRDAG